jgi:hypothetical protein
MTVTIPALKDDNYQAMLIGLSLLATPITTKSNSDKYFPVRADRIASKVVRKYGQKTCISKIYFVPPLSPLVITFELRGGLFLLEYAYFTVMI